MIFVGECCWVWAKSGIPVGGRVIRQGVKEVFFSGETKRRERRCRREQHNRGSQEEKTGETGDEPTIKG